LLLLLTENTALKQVNRKGGIKMANYSGSLDPNLNMSTETTIADNITQSKSVIAKAANTTATTVTSTTKTTDGGNVLGCTKGTMSKTSRLNVGMQLFGLPYQFLDATDHRDPDVLPSSSSKKISVGRKFIDNMITDSAVVTIIPGEPRYLPGVKDKIGWTNALLDAANGSFSNLKSALKGTSVDQIRLYEFQSSYVKYYMYVNNLCRAAAGFLELSDSTGYQINGHSVNFLKYDWKNYRWENSDYSSTLRNVGLGAVSSISGSKVDLTDPNASRSNTELDKAENLLKSSNYIQFYVDADTSRGSESLSNNSGQSSIKQALDTGSSAMREVAFMANSSGLTTSDFGSLGESAITDLTDLLTSSASENANANGLTGIVSNLLSAGKSVLRGENIMMPDIWTGTTNSKSYEITLNFRSPYGNRVSNYVDCIVPMLHCVGLAYPRGTSANSYASPPLVKIYKRGEWTCNMGIVQDITIERANNEDAFNIDNTPMEISVRMSIADLYSDVALTPPNDTVAFANNSALIEFLATSCGLDLNSPNLSKKASVLWNNATTSFTDIPNTVIGKVTETFDRAVSAFAGL
jgi:hypothetical protein